MISLIAALLGLLDVAEPLNCSDFNREPPSDLDEPSREFVRKSWREAAYRDALGALHAGEFDTAHRIFTCLTGYRDSNRRLVEVANARAEHAAAREASARCAADAECVRAQDLQTICEAWIMRRDTNAQIAREWRYARETGVVDLALVRDLKEELQALDSRMEDLSLAYRETYGRRVSLRECTSR